jgi:porphobilinogen synthase
MLQEHQLSPTDFILPLFIRDSEAIESEIEGMPGIQRLTIAEAVQAVEHAANLGISAVMLFPSLPSGLRSHDAAEAYNPAGLIPRAIRALKMAIAETRLCVGIITDIALDPYTIDGHDGITVDGQVDNDATLPILQKQALCYAESGADIVAPSDMMDGRVAAIRSALDGGGFINTGIMSYSAKFCSALYKPFRRAVGLGSARSAAIDKSGYQLAVSNNGEAMRAIARDIAEGADTIIVKPALMYLDIIKEASLSFNVPIIGYIVSGEYAMLNHMTQTLGDISVVLEACMGLKRAGARAIVAYDSMRIAEALRHHQ